ncbi:hypothetical protein ACWEFJ_24790 [Actinosynnema sp. NPDC004786]
MDIGDAERSDRRRRQDGTAHRAPTCGEPAAERPAAARDPFGHPDAVGLCKFNIGLVPASVTPPRTWKAAAWFAVLSSAGVLVGLAVAAANLVGSSGPAERIALPGYPTDVPLLTHFPTSPPPTTTAEDPGRTPAEASAAGLAGGEGVGGGSPVGRTDGATAAQAASPVVTTVPATDGPVVDPEAIAVSTELFYEQVAADTDTALTLVSDTFRATGEALLHEDFADVAAVEVREISVDPVRGVTVSTLHLTRKDGTTTTEKRELSFTTDGPLMIHGERRAPGA